MGCEASCDQASWLEAQVDVNTCHHKASRYGSMFPAAKQVVSDLIVDGASGGVRSAQDRAGQYSQQAISTAQNVTGAAQQIASNYTQQAKSSAQDARTTIQKKGDDWTQKARDVGDAAQEKALEASEQAKPAAGDAAQEEVKDEAGGCTGGHGDSGQQQCRLR